MTELDGIKLENIDPEDIGDILVRLEKSFGDICDIIEHHIDHEHQDTCTTQQAFYKVRNAISQTLSIDERFVNLDTDLTNLFPRKYRRQNIKKFQQQLGIEFDILRMKEWLVV